jgi:hypothetical protein
MLPLLLTPLPAEDLPAESDDILLFRTNIRTLKDVRHVQSLFAELPIERWTVDTKDCDCVLRIVSVVLRPAVIIGLLTEHGYRCAEL